MQPFLAGEVLTADRLNETLWKILYQGTDATVSSSTTLVDSGLVVPILGRTIVRLGLRYQSPSGGGGIRLAWRTTGTVSGRANWLLPGATSTGNVDDRSSGNWRNSGLGTEQVIGHATTASTSGGWGEAAVTGEGDLILQWAQAASAAPATTLFADTYARWIRPLEVAP